MLIFLLCKMRKKIFSKHLYVIITYIRKQELFQKKITRFISRENCKTHKFISNMNGQKHRKMCIAYIFIVQKKKLCEGSSFIRKMNPFVFNKFKSVKNDKEKSF